jgi:cytochrome c oxidase accessory protein FixG
MQPTPPASPSGAPAVSPPPAPAASRELLAELYRFKAPEALTTLDAQGNRKWVYPAAISGVFMRARGIVAYVLIAILFALPWIRIGGMPAILLQIEERRFILFGHVFWPQDMFYLALLLLGFALCLFFFTALAGRVWCGWACPQTVFLEGVFRRVEEWIEGDHHERKRLDEGPWTAAKVGKKALKHGVFLVFAALVSNTFLAYFVGTDRLQHWVTGPPAEHWTAFLIMAFTLGVFYFDFAWFREQFCVLVCPYARFQAVLTDAHTVQVGYDGVRGEPRGRLGTTRGDCIDCHKCVVVCPTGIDIRDGFQLECIGCARCIDACDSIMTRIGKPTGLIRYDSLSRLGGAATRILRPRVIVYSLLLAGVIAALFIGLGVRPLVDLTVVRPAGEPFTLLPGGLISNHFTVRLINRADQDRAFRLAILGQDRAQLITALNPAPVKAGEQVRLEAFINIPRGAIHSGMLPLKVQVYDGASLVAEQGTTFLAPVAP